MLQLQLRWASEYSWSNIGCHCHTAAQKRLFRSFWSKIWSRHSLWLPRFPIRQMYFHYWVTFTGYIKCFCATMSRHFVTFWPWQCFVYIASHARHTYPLWLPYDYPLLSYWIWLYFRYQAQSLYMRHVTCPMTLSPGDKNGPHFWNPWHKFSYSLVTFRALRQRLSHVIGKNSVYPIVKATSSLHMRSIT